VNERQRGGKERESERERVRERKSDRERERGEIVEDRKKMRERKWVSNIERVTEKGVESGRIFL